MACLGSVLYDPGTLATKSTASLLAMTALDTTNARITFTAPASGNVLVRIRAAEKGATSSPVVLLGILDGATVRGRQTPIAGVSNNLALANNLQLREVAYVVTGLTPGNSFTWDAAYAVQGVVASTQLGWGGPDDTTASNAYGALSFEVWDAANLLAGTLYDPAVQVTKSTASAIAMTALDTTNLRLTFTSPASGKVLVRLRGTTTGASTNPAIHLGVLDGATVKGRQAAYCFTQANASATGLNAVQAEFVVSVAANTSFTWDAAYAVETVVASTNIVYGGPNDASGADASGGFAFEVWKA